MTCLFILRESKGGKPIPSHEYDDKMAAKKARDLIGGTTVVSYGHDHKNYEANKAEKKHETTNFKTND